MSTYSERFATDKTASRQFEQALDAADVMPQHELLSRWSDVKVLCYVVSLGQVAFHRFARNQLDRVNNQSTLATRLSRRFATSDLADDRFQCKLNSCVLPYMKRYKKRFMDQWYAVWKNASWPCISC